MTEHWIDQTQAILYYAQEGHIPVTCIIVLMVPGLWMMLGCKLG